MMNGTWIWLADGQTTENERGCFAQTFSLDTLPQVCEIRITAVTRYTLFCNGRVVGYGPVRTDRKTAYYDTYGLEDCLRPGENYIAVQVWNYGWSTYQSLADEGGLLYDIMADGVCVAASGPQVRAQRDLGYESHAPKRNANLGFTDYYDARRFSFDWVCDVRQTLCWPQAAVCASDRQLLPRPVRPYQRLEQYPKRLIQTEDVDKGCQVVTVNTRQAFYGDRRDADETTINGLIGCVLEVPEAMSGRISFPNRTWNGMIGTFRIGSTVYPVTDRARDVEVQLPAGESLFLLQLNGKYDDLYCHLEFRFPQRVNFRGMGTDHCFFVIGPTNEVWSDISGKGTIYDEMLPLSQAELDLFHGLTLEKVDGKTELVKWVAAPYVMEDMYLLSLNRLAQPRKVYTPTQDNLGILWNNSQCTVVDLPACGDYRRLLLDFGDMTIGSLEFTVWAKAGTILDFYCFENSYRGEIDFTIGLNNGIRYICRDGWQHYRAMARLGGRYVILSVREASEPVKIRDFHMEYLSYASGNRGFFESSDDQLNAIWKMCAQTHQMCLEDSFTDSPVYEQSYWLGDAQVSSLYNAYVFGDYELCRRTLQVGTLAEANTPLFNALAPTDWNTSIPMWTMNWFISIVQYVENSGDRTVLSELYEPMHRMMTYYRSLLTEKGGLLTSAWNMIDWAPMDLPSCCVPTAYQGMVTYCFNQFANIAEGLGHFDHAAQFHETAARTRRYLNETLWDEQRQAFRDGWSPERGLSTTYSMQTHMLLRLYDVIDGQNRRDLTEQYLLHQPEDFVSVGSPFILYYLYECWASCGKLDEMLQDIKKRWGEMFRYETTTCWEVFPGFYENSRTRSYCHSWSAAPAMLMQKYLLGIHRDSEGFEDVSFRFPETQLRWCRGTIPTPHGTILVDWNKDIGEYRLQIPKKIRLHGEPPAGFHAIIEYTQS